ncbi:MAG TPA: DinB family protein [Gemmatimonadaceae bacterium]|nr:DinB family protein [Gemmatimonadaceae bacterium]
MSSLDPLRQQLQQALDWEDAHAGFEDATSGIPEGFRGLVPTGLVHSAWQLVEHMRLVQNDILDFCVNPGYRERTFPDDYWPKTAAPRSAEAWNRSLADFQKDRAALKALAGDPGVDLFATIPHGTGQTYLRELILVIDHTAYHLGQLLDVRRALGAWSRS